MNFIWITILCCALFYAEKARSLAGSVDPVPPVPDCGAVCGISCPFGNVLDKDGCPICKCRTGCLNEMPPLPHIDCGRVRPKCPKTHECVFPIHNPKTGVCCRRVYY